MKSQFGPDAIIGMVILLIISLGGVFFIHMFVNGFSIQSVITVLDKEVDQRCLYLLLPTARGEYVKSGDNDNLDENSNLYATMEYFGGTNIHSKISSRCVNKIKSFSGELNILSTEFNQGNMKVYGVCGDPSIPTDIFYSYGSVCSMDLYNPAGPAGVATISIEGINALGTEGTS